MNVTNKNCVVKQTNKMELHCLADNNNFVEVENRTIDPQ